jgi:hypothetical protein
VVRPQNNEPEDLHLPQGSRQAAERWAGLPLGELHPVDKCAFCGIRGEPLIYTVILSTNAPGRRCVDSVACIRRRPRR